MRWTVVVPLLVYAVLIAPWIDFVPTWDGTTYYDCIRKAVLGSSVRELFCERHLTLMNHDYLPGRVYVFSFPHLARVDEALMAIMKQQTVSVVREIDLDGYQMTVYQLE